MAALTWYLTNNSASIGSDLSETDPGAEAYRSPVTGWIVSVVTAGNYSSYFNDVERAAVTFSATPQPDGSLDTTNGDFWTSPAALTGSFAATDWTIAVAVRANTRQAGQDGRIRVRIFKGTNQDGSSATEITSAATAGTTVTDLLTSVTQVSTVTVTPGAFSVSNEYIFVQIAWEITGDSSNATADVNLRIGNGSGAGCRVVTSEFTEGGGGGSNTAGQKLATGVPEKQINAVPYISSEGYQLIVTDYTGTISDDPANWPPDLKEAVAKCCCERTTSSSMVSKAYYPSPCCPTLAADTLSGRVAGTVAHNTGLRLRYNPAFTLNFGIISGIAPDWLPIEGLKHPWGHNAHWWSDLYEDYSYSVNQSGVWRIITGNIFTPFIDIPYTAVYDCSVYFYVKYGHRVGLPATTCNSQLVQIAYPVGQFIYDPVAYQQAINLFITMPPNPEPITWQNLIGNSLGAFSGLHGVRNALGFSGTPRYDNIVGEAETSAGCHPSEYHICNNTLQSRKVFLGTDFPSQIVVFNTVINPLTFSATSGTGTMQVMMNTANREPAFNCFGIGIGDPSVLATRPRIEVDA